MLQRWKEKIKQLFATETETPKKKQTYHVPQQSLHTKVTYKYPKNPRFRFPVIPDEPLDTPAYLRKQQSQREMDFIERETKNRINEKPVRSIKKEPFRPSRVASPIYGYRPRESMSEVEEVPAFIRKQEAQTNQNDETTKNITSLNAETYEQRGNDSPQQTEWANEFRSVNESQSEISAHLEAEPDSATRVKSPRPTQTQAEDSRLVRRHQRTSQQKCLEDNHRSSQQTERQTNTGTSFEKRNEQTSRDKPIPYNVMMTPRDKIKLRNQHQQKRTERHQHIRSNEQNNRQTRSNKQTDQMTQSTNQNNYQIPLHLLNDVEKGQHEDRRWIKEQQALLEQTLKHFNVKAKVVKATQGPAVTRFEVQPALGVKVSRVRNLSDDIKLNMAAKDIRIEAPIPGKHTIGIEVPNHKTQTVGLQDILQTSAFNQDQSPLTIGLGLDVEGRAKVTDIAKMPHGLIAGATGSGKSVCINTIIISLLYKSSYEDVKLLLIDPKMVELTPYNGIPHLIAPVITDIKAATAALQWAVNEMEERYQKFVTEGVRSIEKYNEKMLAEDRKQEKMPYIVIIIDELADLMMVAPQDVEDAISRIAQKARACGIHLIVATQRPSVDVITGLIKANIPTRIAFSVSSQVDSRTIIDMNGAERLLGKGDMLFIENGTGKALRLQGAFVSDDEIDRITTYLRQLSPPNYLFEQEHLVEKMEIAADEDEILPEVIEFVVEQSQVSTSLLQRQFRIGYNRAARLIDTLEDKGVISGQNGSKPRDVLVSKEQLQDIIS